MRRSSHRFPSLQTLIGGIFVSQTALGAVVPRSNSCHSQHYLGPVNPSFETGDLSGWQVINGTAFGNASVSSAASYWGGPFNQVGKTFLWGFSQAGDTAVGRLRSSTFRASSVMSFLVGGGYDPARLFVGLVLESDGRILLKQTGVNDEALIRVIWDTSEWAGQNVHMIVYDDSDAGSWGHINLDDIRTGCDALGDGGLSFNVLGQSNQPAGDTSAACSLYAADPLRPQFHYTPYQGWINDPAGLIQWQGHHHLFSQFNPAAPQWGPMHWAHAESTDAVHWRELPTALYPPFPDNPLDASGRFTGSAVADGPNNGTLRLIFTDFTDTAVHPGKLPEVVSTATSTDGIQFALDPNNPIIAAPAPGSSSGFRDPKVFRDPVDDSWKMVVGSGDAVSGKVHLYRSNDLLTWDYVGVLHEGDGSTGTMWECPNFFPLGDKWVLFYGGNSLGWYETGTYDGSSFKSEKKGLLDAGPDSYAMQYYTDASGRNLVITWMGNWPTPKWPSRINGWAGQQSITRELFLRPDGGLGNRPIAELASLAVASPTQLGPQKIRNVKTIGRNTTARLQLEVDLASPSATAFTVLLFYSSAESVNLTYTFADQTLTLDTTNAGYGQAGTWKAVVAIPGDKKLTLDVFVDRSSLEIFAGDGTVMTATVWPKYQESSEIKLKGLGGAVTFDVITLTPLGSSWC